MDFEEFISSNVLDRDQVVDDDGQSHYSVSSEMSDSLDHQIHEHKNNLEVIENMDFEPIQVVQPEAVVKTNDRYIAVAVSKPQFEFDDKEFIGISPDTPGYTVMEGKKAGDVCKFNNTLFEIQKIF